MKFLIITNHSYMLWQFRRELISALMERGEVVISMPFVGHEDDFAEMGCRCIETELDRRGLDPFSELRLYRTYKRLIGDEKPDAVITYSIKPNVYAGRVCSKMRIPYFVNVQGLGTAFQKKPIAAVVTAMYRSALKRANTVFFENESNANEFVSRGIIKRERITVLSGAGVNLSVYSQEEYPSEAEGIRFLYLGRIMKEKGMDELFAAAEKLKERYGERIGFDLVGFFEDDYKERVEALEAAGTVRFHGFQSDPKPFYKAAHCVVLPSYHEGMSNVLLEAAATGRALVTSDIPGCREAVDEGVNGFLCRKADSESLEECLARFMELDEGERRLMGERGRAKMEEEFDKKKVVAKTLETIMDGLERPLRSPSP